MVITWPGPHAAVALSPSSGADHLGCINCTWEMKGEGKQRVELSCHVRTHTHLNVPPRIVTVQFRFGRSGALGNSSSTWLQTGDGNNRYRHHSNWAEIQRSHMEIELKDCNNHPTYAIVPIHVSHNKLVQLNGDCSEYPGQWYTPPLVAGDYHQCQCNLYHAEIQ